MNLAHQISALWITRNHGDWLKARSEFYQIAVECGFDVRKKESSWLIPVPPETIPVALQLDLVALEASFVRREVSPTESLKFLNRILNSVDFPGFERHFAVQFQWGMNHYTACDYWQALKHFLVAEKVARTEDELDSNTINLLLCLEMIGLDYRDRLEEFQHQRSSLKAGALSQLEALEMRDAMRMGRLSSLVQHAEKIKAHFVTHSFTQSDFFALNHCSHPLWQKKGLENSQSLSMVSKQLKTRYMNSSEYAQSFYIGNLTENPSLPGESDFAFRFWTERLYQWVWFFLEEPTAERAVLLNRCLRKIQQHPFQNLSRECYLFAKLAIRWLSLIIPEYHSLFSGYLQGTVAANQGVTNQTLDFETTLVEALEFLRSQRWTETSMHLNELATKIQQIPDFQNTRAHTLVAELTLYSQSRGCHSFSDAWVKKFIGHVLGEKLTDLSDDPAPYTTRNVLSPLRMELVFLSADLGEDLGEDQGEERISTVLLTPEENRFLVSIIGQNSVRIQDVISSVFGLEQYNPVRHDNRLQHFVGQLNHKLSAVLKIKRRYPLLLLDWKSPDTLTLSGTKSALLLFEAFLMEAPAQNTPAQKHGSTIRQQRVDMEMQEQEQYKIKPKPVKRQAAIAAEKMTGWMSRLDIENYFSWTRSTAHRRLEVLLSKDLIRKRGSGKNTRYFLDPSVIDCLESAKLIEGHKS